MQNSLFDFKEICVGNLPFFVGLIIYVIINSTEKFNFCSLSFSNFFDHNRIFLNLKKLNIYRIYFENILKIILVF